VAEIFKGRIAKMLAWQQGIRVPMLPITTAGGMADQIRHLLG